MSRLGYELVRSNALAAQAHVEELERLSAAGKLDPLEAHKAAQRALDCARDALRLRGRGGRAIVGDLRVVVGRAMQLLLPERR